MLGGVFAARLGRRHQARDADPVLPDASGLVCFVVGFFCAWGAVRAPRRAPRKPGQFQPILVRHRVFRWAECVGGSFLFFVEAA